MSDATYFAQPCPGCKRMTRKLVQYLGREVRCRHCGRQFLCCDTECNSAADEDPVHYWLNYTDQVVAESNEFDRNRSPR